LIFFLPLLAFAERPDEGGFFSYTDSDVLTHYDLGVFRVHYSIEGPNQTILDDEDQNGIPDFVEEVALTAEEVFSVYEETGFRIPLTEAEIGLELGGSPAFDYYLVDFGGSSDGMFGIDGCIGSRCAGHMIIENDFSGYGYSSLTEAISVLVSHEFFHAVQASYHSEMESWLSEGMAVWAEHLFEPETKDFLAFSSAYLEDTERSINRPPAGMTTAFSYGTALWFAFLQEQKGEGILVSILEAFDQEEDSSAAMFSVLGDETQDLWTEFARWNLATGIRSGEVLSYPYADRLYGLQFAEDGVQLVEDHRFYPFAASYFLLEHTGGTLKFTIEEGGQGLIFSLHPTEDQVVFSAVETWTGAERKSWDLPAGIYYLVGSFAERDSNSQKRNFCLGATCFPDEEEVDDDVIKEGCGGENAYLFLILCTVFQRRLVRKKNSPSSL